MGHPPRHLLSPPAVAAEDRVLRVLVVSHDDGMRELLSTHLGRAGHVVSPTDSGQVALELLAAADERAPHVAIVDWTAPGLRARDLIHALKSRRPGLWVIALSASERVAHPRLIGWDELIQKPFSMRSLVRSLRSCRPEATRSGTPQTSATRSDATRSDAVRTSVTRIRRPPLATAT
jgi:DNA-binding response OmpR family regulator